MNLWKILPNLFGVLILSMDAILRERTTYVCHLVLFHCDLQTENPEFCNKLITYFVISVLDISVRILAPS